MALGESYVRAEDIRVRVRDGLAREGYSGSIKIKPSGAYRVVKVRGDSTGVGVGSGVILVAGVFAVVTIGVMMTLTMLATFGLDLVHVKRMERYAHALAGTMIFLCGVGIHLGL